MNQFRPNNDGGFQDLGFPGFADAQSSEFRSPHQSYNSSHGMPCPTNLSASRSPSDQMDLSQYDALAKASVNGISVQDVIKSQNSMPWAGTHQNNSFQPHILDQTTTWQGNNNISYPKSEPALKHDGRSDAADSGYFSHLTTATPTNQNTFNFNRDELEQPSFLSQSFDQDGDDVKSIVSDGRIISGNKDGRKRQQIGPCQYPGCGKRPKNLSDAKKHALTHSKPFRCSEPNCGRKDGFATDNDLQRHRKSVHNLLPTVGSAVGYICQACVVPEGQSPKFWPRRDNFKAHIKRKHPQVNEDQLIERSKRTTRPDDAKTVDDDNQSVRTAMRSAAQMSQVDPEEAHGYSTSPIFLSRHISDPGNYMGSSLWPNMAHPEDALAGMHGHTADLQYCTSPLEADESSSMHILPSNMGSNHFSGLSPPSKRLRVDQCHWSFPNEHHQQVPPFQFQVSEHNTASSAAPSPSQSTARSSHTFPRQRASGGNPRQFKCKHCDKIKPRDCDLKKHEKRHTRPYGCTFPDCNKRFGSRNDWKRHESSQHYLHKAWKCRSCASTPLFFNANELRKHLLSPLHDFPSHAAVEKEISLCKLGRSGYDHFWCGFCQDLILANKTELEVEMNAWDERAKHIGEHFDKHGWKSEQWVCAEEHQGLRNLKEEEEGELPEYDPGLGLQAYNCTGGMYMSADRKMEQEDDDHDAEGVSDYE